MKARLMVVLQPWLQRWQVLSPEERTALSVGAAALGGFLLIAGLYLPLQVRLAQLREAVPADAGQLALMQNQARRVGELRARGAGAPGRGGNVLATLEQSANAKGLRGAITRLEPDGGSGARLTLDAVAFNQLVAWLNELQIQNGLRVENAQIEPQTAPGMVSARLVLRGAVK